MIEVNGVGVEFDGLRALAPVDLRVARGEAVAVRGENGSGKTTLLRVIAGLQQATAGAVTVGGAPVGAGAARVSAMIGLLDPDDGRTVREVLTSAFEASSTDAGEVAASATALAARLDVTALLDRLPHEGSAGERQRVALAAALATPCDLLLLDEPERRLDGDRLGAVIAEIRRAHARGVTVLIATHSDRIAAEAADREVWLPDTDA